MRIATPGSMSRYFASILTLVFSGVLSPFSPVNHAVARRSAPTTVTSAESMLKFEVHEVRCAQLQPIMRRNIPVRTVSQPRSPITVLRLRTGSGSLADASNGDLLCLDPVVQVKTNRACAKDNRVSKLEAKFRTDLIMPELRLAVFAEFWKHSTDTVE